MDVEMVADSILDSPKGSEYGGDVIPADSALPPHDAPGPSSTFIPPTETYLDPVNPPPSPPLPPFDEDDEVVARLPVYISPSLAQNLAIFQYPLQHRSLRVPTWAADRGKRITSRVKEGVGRVEVEVPVDANAGVWRDERARELAFVPANTVNGEEGKKKKEIQWGDKMRLRSEVVPTKEGTYFSGIVHEGALHLHPINRMLQFRTSLAYLDDYDNKNRPRAVEEEEKKKVAQRKDLPKSLDDPNNDGSGSIKDFRTKMWSMQAREDEEKWVPYEWNEGAENEAVTESLENLLVHQDRRGMLDCKMRGLDYLDRHHR
ncbi:hypothetical protein CcaverHIS002_0107660 [Cutaneotrichosporon cavernicola]|uniref:DNA-directed RNA polymerase III subunit RPC5 n=1 Tax=Cutaneotrichosporon cavernicola TaxID=279322 RepID=A0AA48HYU7_9TREE|nr:uncharacterized protein CcaverHIS019_0107620 [Cutaneotrichosporon cavernicola]BEI80237.1 hypothetical protein CcaverHIS002_0107660 [Cutaneotrichosporon cavernicola]BEI88044.1 hypothetical protein CcaverHIS019_0107620 [Cutaneotrichosporon cavernicola]BEI95816.1 hypothetical protein CcaverHIS631_0107650 [Cutaneotrichosporon cavernicola]